MSRLVDIGQDRKFFKTFEQVTPSVEISCQREPCHLLFVARKQLTSDRQWPLTNERLKHMPIVVEGSGILKKGAGEG